MPDDLDKYSLKPPEFVSPIKGTFSSGFDSDRPGGRKHKAVDLRADPGTPFVAPRDLTVNATFQGGKNMRADDWGIDLVDKSGRLFKFVHTGDMSHLSKGDRFTAGEQIGTVGSVISHPHLHMAVYDQEGNPINLETMAGLEKGKTVPRVWSGADTFFNPSIAHSADLSKYSLEPPKSKDLSKYSLDKPKEVTQPQSVLIANESQLGKTPSPFTIQAAENYNRLTKTGLPYEGALKIQGTQKGVEDLISGKLVKDVIDFPHEKISKPLGRYLSEIIPTKTKADKEALAELTPYLIDLPTYWGVSKPLEWLGSGVSRLLPAAKTVEAPEVVVGKGVASSLEEHEAAELLKPKPFVPGPKVQAVRGMDIPKVETPEILRPTKSLEELQAQLQEIDRIARERGPGMVDVAEMKPAIKPAPAERPRAKGYPPEERIELTKAQREAIGVPEADTYRDMETGLKTIEKKEIQPMGTGERGTLAIYKLRSGGPEEGEVSPQLAAALQFKKNVDYLDSIGASDSQYRDLLSTGAKGLAKGDTWAAKARRFAERGVEKEQAFEVERKAGKLYGGGPDIEDIKKMASKYTSAGLSATESIARVAKDVGTTNTELMSALKEGRSPKLISEMSNLKADNPAQQAGSVLWSEGNRQLVEEMNLSRTVSRDQRTIPERHGFGLSSEIPEVKSDIPYRGLEQSYRVIKNKLGEGKNFITDFTNQRSKWMVNVQNARTVFGNIIKDAGIGDDILASERVVQQRLGPIFKAYRDEMQPVFKVQDEIAALKKQAERFPEGTPKGMEVKDALAAKQAELKALEKAGVGIRAERDKIIKELMVDHPNIRIKLAAEGNPDALALIKPNEEAAVRETRKYLDQVKSEMQSQGMHTIEDRPYVPWGYPGTWFGEEPTKGLSAFTRGLWYESAKRPTPEFLEFVKRTGDNDWFPLWSQTLNAYIGSAEHKLAFNPWLSKWIGQARPTWEAQGHSNLVTWLNNYTNRALGPQATMPLAHWTNKLVNMEYTHQLFGSVSAAVMHMFKPLRIMADQLNSPLGVLDLVRGVGGLSKAAGQMALGREGAERTMMNYFANPKELTRAITQDPGMNEMLKPEVWRKIVRGAGTAARSPVAISEWLGNGINIFATAAKGQRLGLPAETIRNAIVENVLQYDFRAHAYPRVFTQTGGLRAVTQFGAQPTMQTGTLIDWTKGGKDLYGNSNGAKFVRFLILAGLAYEGGKAAGVDLSRQIGHMIPFVEMNAPELAKKAVGGEEGEFKEELRAIQFRLPPILSFGANVEKKGLEEATRQWAGWPGPALGKLFKEDIPERYDESRPLYIMGIPSAEAHERVLSKKRLKAWQDASRKQKPTTTEELWDNMLFYMGVGE